jgi:hypothetical protein
MRDERSLAAVPRRVWIALGASLAAQIALQSSLSMPAPSAADLPAAPRPAALRLASLDEPEAAARLAMLYLQAFDLGGTNSLPYRNLDYSRLIAWLRAILQLDPRSEYPLFSAARIYAEVPDAARTRLMLEFIYEEFQKDPERRWPWLAHATLVAKHRLGDLALARRYASAIDRLASKASLPLWARHMEIFILEDMSEIQAAKIMLGGLLDSGVIKDPNEARFLQKRMEELEARSRRTPVK